MAKAKERKIVFLIELKTDDSSRNSKQDWYLRNSLKIGFDQLLEGIRGIYAATNHKNKYDNLLNELERLGFIKAEINQNIRIIRTEYQTRLVYIQPNVKDDKELSIGFEEIADIIEKRQDALSMRFSKSLREWRKSKAGEKYISWIMHAA